VGLVAPALALVVAETPFGRGVERKLYDGWFGVRGTLPKPDDVVIVAIDLDSEESIGRYPWSREWHARLIRNLARAGAKVVAFDATFADPFPREDPALRQIIDSTGIVVLGAKTEVVLNRNAVGSSLEEPGGDLRGVPIGIVDFAADPVDGAIREYPILNDYAQGPVPQLGVEAVLRYLGLPRDALVPDRDGWRLGDREIPRGVTDRMLLNFLGPTGSVPTYSYVTVVDDADTDLGDWDMDTFEDLDAEDRFRGKIVFVGTTVPEHHDDFETPTRDMAFAAGSTRMSGVEIHANAAETILADRFIHVYPRRIQYLWTFLLGLLVVATAPRVKGIWGVGFAIGLAALAIYGSWSQFAQGAWLWAFAPVTSVFFSWAGSSATLYLVEEQKAAQIRGMFSQYVDASVVDELIKRPELLALGGEEREISIMFSDVADFSTISESLTPTELVALLNEYLTAMTDVVIKHGGIIDKYQGDCIMAEFGAPLPFDDHALRSCRAALEMVAELGRLREKWAAEGKPRLFARVGVNTGKALVGNLGSRHFSDYTAMGDHVNLASRLEGANKPYGTRIMVSEWTWAAIAGEMYGRELDRIKVKGKTLPVSVYEVMGRRPDGIPAEREELISSFTAALDLYKQARFAEAVRAFEDLAVRFPEDGPTKLYVERCKEFIADPPPPDWDGVYEMKTK
jgi:adenylate cyclase